MGQFSVKIYTSPGSLLSANQHQWPYIDFWIDIVGLRKHSVRLR
jgi:hypothetical protein